MRDNWHTVDLSYPAGELWMSEMAKARRTSSISNSSCSKIRSTISIKSVSQLTYVYPSTIRSSTRLSHHTHHCTPFPQTPQGHFSEFTIIFPPLLPTIILDFTAFTYNPLSRRLALHSATRLPSCSIVGSLSTRSSAYSNSEGSPFLASLETTSMTAANNSGLSTDP